MSERNLQKAAKDFLLPHNEVFSVEKDFCKTIYDNY